MSDMQTMQNQWGGSWYARQYALMLRDALVRMDLREPRALALYDAIEAFLKPAAEPRPPVDERDGTDA